ncbi:hypothetical protein D918_09963 [Trichuris suis]|nr:hypothetical protein D918_09963 [Trichuris suis]
MHHQERPNWQGMDGSLGGFSFPYLHVERAPARRCRPRYIHHRAQLGFRGGYSTNSRYPFNQRGQPYRGRLSQNYETGDHFVDFERYFDSMLSYPWTELEKQWKETMRRLTENGVLNPAQHVLSEIEDIVLKKFKSAPTCTNQRLDEANAEI